MSIFPHRRPVDPSSDVAGLPDPMDRLPHSGNKEFFQYLMDDWQRQGRPSGAVYAFSPHPDMVALFDQFIDQLAGASGITKDTVYGVRLAATPYHLVFAWARGMDAIFVKLRPEWHKEALADGGRLDATYPPDWVEFIPGRRLPAARQSQWRAIILHWMQVSYDDSVKGTAAARTSSSPVEPSLKRPAAEAAKQPSDDAKDAPRATRVTLTFITHGHDLDSLDPICTALLGPQQFNSAIEIRRRSSGQALIMLSDKTDLSVTFPAAAEQETPNVISMLASVSTFLSSLFRGRSDDEDSTGIIVRGALPEIMPISGALADWVGERKRRKARLEIWEDIHLEAEASTSEEVQSMFQRAQELASERSLP